MTMPKKLIETALPLDAINAESAREKSIRQGHPSTMHLWWARRPLATARAVLWSSLVDDPSSHPQLFPTEEEQDKERKRLHSLLAKLVKWENTTNEEILEEARAEIRKYMGDDPLVFLDPFAGGGAIPLEAQRLGLEAHAHDLNPVAVMINKAMIEIPPRFAGKPPVNPDAKKGLGAGRAWPGATGLASDVHYYGSWMKEEAFRRIGHLYPKVQLTAEQGGGEAIVIAWIWARTVPCPNPACGCTMPLASSFVLSKKKGNEAWVEPVVTGKTITFAVHQGKCPKDKETNKLGKGGVFKCPVCGATTETKYLYDVFTAKKNGAVLMAVVAEGAGGRRYLSPDEAQKSIVGLRRPEDSPDIEIPCPSKIQYTRNYGLNTFADLFTPRQLTALTTLSDLVAEAQQKAIHDAMRAGMDDGTGLADGGTGATAYGQAVGVYLAFVLDKMVDYHSTICIWHTTRELVANTMRRQAIQMTWDYAEGNPFCTSSGCFANMLAWVEKALLCLPAHGTGAAAQQDAQSDCGLRNLVISSDPPYYDNICYADISDYFFIWLRHSLKTTYPRLFKTMLVPKAEELVASPYRFNGSRQKARLFFEEGMIQACQRMYDYARDDVPVTIYYAYKQSETDNTDNTQTAQASTGWETMLSAIITAGFAITGTWPMRTELTTALKGSVNALASSIVLVCRKRPGNAPSCSRKTFLAELKQELRPALKKLQASSIAPVDMAQAAIGPGMAVYSKYKQVLEADGTPMNVRKALQLINQELDAYLTEQEGDMDAHSRFCLALYAQYAFNDVAFGDAEVLSRAKNTSIDTLEDLGLVQAEKGIVHLQERKDLPEHKANSSTPTPLWLLTQQLTYAMQEDGNDGCAEIIANVSSTKAEQAKNLAYRLYTLAEQKGWSQEAYAYNALVVAWAEIQDKVLNNRKTIMEQGTLF